jgi:hypothetical protein
VEAGTARVTAVFSGVSTVVAEDSTTPGPPVALRSGILRAFSFVRVIFPFGPGISPHANHCASERAMTAAPVSGSILPPTLFASMYQNIAMHRWIRMPI